LLPGANGIDLKWHQAKRIETPRIDNGHVVRGGDGWRRPGSMAHGEFRFAWSLMRSVWREKIDPIGDDAVGLQIE